MELLSKIKIPSYIIDIPFLWDDRYDGELRKTILNDAFLINHKETFQNFINCSDKNNTILLMHDSFACDYIYIKLPDSKKAFFAGPFSFEKFTNQRIVDLCSYNSIPPRFTDFMQLYYAALPVFADERCIEAIINCLCNKLWNSYTIEKKHFLNKNASEYMYNDYTPEPTKQSIEVLEQRYNDESLLMEYVAHGDFESIDKLAHLNSSGIKPRLSDSIRDRKNFMIILNTLCRKAAQSAYVHPIHLDEISRKFAIRIESCTTIAQLETLESEITRKYCLLVQSYSLRKYSKPVQNIINYISFNLTDDLSLNTISAEFALNSSYVSSLFIDDNGTPYLSFVRFNDGNNIWIAELEKDLITIKKETMHPCLHVTQEWEKVWPRVNEGSYILKHNGIYYMSYSANSYESPFYGVGCATATDLMGTWTKYDENPLLQKPGKRVGVGHSAMFTDKAGKLRIVYHAHKDKDNIGTSY